MTEEMERLFDSQAEWTRTFETISCHMTEKEERWGYVQEDKAFIDAILNGTPPPVTADDGFKSVELVEAVYRGDSDWRTYPVLSLLCRKSETFPSMIR